MNHHVIGLQFHFEQTADGEREMVTNGFPYVAGTILKQIATEITNHPISVANQRLMFRLLDYINE
ncbi:hypothetical protein MOO44_08430 [Nicoliella spurrieriana]|uniref:Uncharacterized protein n=1 Tax=Nicoliella spurrieriana TaxID=2925830 RepID=A0A976RSC8_9LACO|nr:hypothetical protein [Nicoliella spurrieriana]UQS86875.1 hypothetical protein MOO44_08430 [Nicoliella spurrieriana]